MTHHLLDRDHQLDEAFALVYRGLASDADRPRLADLFSKLLRIPVGECESVLQHPPLQISFDTDRDKLKRHQMGLAKMGCIASIEPGWKYTRWSIPDKLKQSFASTPEGGRIFALLQIHPAPGHARLLRLSSVLTDVRYYALNHGEILLESKASIPGGAGSWLRDIRERVTPLIKSWQAESRLESSFALLPEDGELVTDILDLLSERLSSGTQPSPRPKIAEHPNWPVAGIEFGRLYQSGLMPESMASDPQTGLWLRQHWPLREIESTRPVADASRLIKNFQSEQVRREARANALLDRFSALDKLPSLPGVAIQAYRLAQDPDGNGEELTRAVEKDPSLSTRLLAIVNSAYFGLRSRVDSIAHALVILGREEVAHLALMVSSETVFRGLSNEAGQKLWRHSARTADIARILAKQFEMESPSAVYTAGLLHDVGRIFLFSVASGICAQLQTRAREQGLPDYELERAEFGHDHATLGAAMLRRWDLPENICQCVEQHHGSLPGHDLSEDAALIGLADHLAHRMDRDESWSDDTRLRLQQIRVLKPYIGEQDLETLDLLAEDLKGQIRQAA